MDSTLDDSKKLKTYCTVTSSKRVYASDYVDEGVTFIRGKEVARRFSHSGRLESELFISRDKFELLRNRFGAPVEGDLLITSVGTLGVPYLVTADDEFYFKDGNLIWFREFTGLNSKYLYYWLQSPSGRAQLSKCTIGTSQPAYTIERLKEIELDGHSKDQQNRIASILSAYDDLIENNRRRIQLLEQATRLLYKEWFVRLRFPGYEGVKVKDGVPEGWERKTYSAVFKFLGGFAFKSKTYQSEGKFGIVTIKNVHDARFVTECPSRLDSVPEKVKEHCVLNTGDILLSLTGNVGRACIVFGENYLLNQRVAKVIGNSGIPRSFTYWTFSNETTQKELENLAYGVAQLNLSPVKLGEREFLKPSPMVLELFGKIADPIFQQITTLNLEIAQLSQARDLLLPRLMSGDLQI